MLENGDWVIVGGGCAVAFVCSGGALMTMEAPVDLTAAVALGAGADGSRSVVPACGFCAARNTAAASASSASRSMRARSCRGDMGHLKLALGGSHKYRTFHELVKIKDL
jgi:hypothetical protein